MRDFFKIIIFFGVVVFMLNGCKTTKPSLPDRPGKIVRVSTAAEVLGKAVQLTIVRDDIDGQKRKKYTEVGADQ